MRSYQDKIDAAEQEIQRRRETMARLTGSAQAVQERLFTVPCAMGMRDTRLTYRELFNGRYPF